MTIQYAIWLSPMEADSTIGAIVAIATIVGVIVVIVANV